MLGRERMAKKKKKKLCKYSNEPYAMDCPHSDCCKILGCNWNDKGCPRYDKEGTNEGSN